MGFFGQNLPMVSGYECFKKLGYNLMMFRKSIRAWINIEAYKKVTDKVSGEESEIGKTA